MPNTQLTPDTGTTPLVDTESGVISREIFLNEQIFTREATNLFARAWLFVGHESQVPEPGDYFSSRMGTDSVLMTRDTAGEIHVLLNSCRHRGMKVCRYDSGNTTQFSCPYHGWSYSVDGSLVSTPGELFGVPQFQKAYGAKLKKEDWGLIPVAQTRNYKGFVFATWDADAPPFEEYVGGFMPWLDNLSDSLGGVPGGTTTIAGVLKWRVKANWKLVAENFLGDMYHAATSHASVEAVGIGPAGTQSSRHGMGPEALAQRRANQHSTSFPALGHGATDCADDVRQPPVFADRPDLTDYFGRLFEKKQEVRRAAGQPLGAHGPATLFPNMSFHAVGFPRTVLVAHPISPWETEMWRWFIVDKDVSDEARDWLRHYYLRYSGPAGLTEQDDMENWDYATEASRGAIARTFPYNYAQGMEMTQPGPLAGSVESTHWSTEENARNYYRRWAQFVEGNPWSPASGDEITSAAPASQDG